MAKLNDTQLVLLSNAARRSDASLYPLPTTLADAGTPVTVAIDNLIGMGCAEEREAADGQITYRVEGDLRYGVFLTEIGLAVLDGGPGADDAGHDDQPRARGSKSEAVIALLEREVGATLDELVTATGWLPHTTRAALTRLRKKGHGIQRSKRGEQAYYHLARGA